MAGKTVFKRQVRVTKRKAWKSTKAKRRVVKGPLRCKGKRRGAFTRAITRVEVVFEMVGDSVKLASINEVS